MRRAQVKGRLNELWALIGALGAGVEKAGASGGTGGERWWTRRVSRKFYRNRQAAAFDEDFAEGSERSECCFGEIECEHDVGRGCWICAGRWG